MSGSPLRRSRLFRWLATLVVLGIAAATLVPIGLRPESGAPPNVERFLAFALFGFVLALALPRRGIEVLVLVALVAFGLEWLQTLIPTRDARLHDALVKLAGGWLGAGLGLLLLAAGNRRRRGPRPSRP